MSYDLSRAIARTKAFTLDTQKSGILLRCTSFGSVAGSKPVKPLEKCDFPAELIPRLNVIIENQNRFMDAHAVLDDCYLPGLTASLGIAEHFCYMGGEVRFGGNTSFLLHPLKELADWKELKCSREYPHYRLLMDGMAYLKEKSAENGYFVQLRGNCCPMDLVNAVRGNEMLYDFYDDEETVSAFLDSCVDDILWNHRNQMEYVSPVDGGILGGMGIWMPENSLGHLSEDASVFCSREMYDRFGLPFTKKLMAHFSFGYLHTHTQGRHMLPEFRKVPQFNVIQITDDPNTPDGLAVLREYDETLRDVIVHITLTADALRANIDYLTKKRMIVDLVTEDIDEAKACIELVNEKQGW